MSKAILEFNLEEIEDKEKYERMMSADKCFNALWEIECLLHQELKYPSKPEISYVEGLGNLSAKYYDILNNNNINMDLWS